ncbi:hypothetical protein B0H15DRAFT_281144 [Mycena belliarum]|uniref:Uncharacterized protein n=1 Tax=Mycena belliarum TaxID=1033014 RepID=A0AAD6U905_9AGAR|nr:hypothetical protein B0H15DRAFT_281144 [Mycena belliae]
MRSAVFLPVLCAAFGLVRATPIPAVDDRLLYKIPAKESMDAFGAAFTSRCSTWEPALHGASLTFLQALVEPGDFSGNNADTEVKLVCAWSNDAGIQTFTADVAASLGATPVSASDSPFLLYAIPAGETMDDFLSAFTSTCTTWPAAEADPSIRFLGSVHELGDFSGNNADTEVRLLCTWLKTDGSDTVEFTADVAASLGATPV